MTLTSWLYIINEALLRVGMTAIPDDATLAANTTKEARAVNSVFVKALERVLLDHNWRVAVRRVFLGSSTLSVGTVLPVGMTEAVGTTPETDYYYPIPTYDPNGVVAGSVGFEIIKIIAISIADTFVERERKIFVPVAVSGQNCYAEVLSVPTFAMAAKDANLTEALKLTLALLIAPDSTGKDNQRDAIIKDELRKALEAGRYEDNTAGTQVADDRTWWGARVNLQPNRLSEDGSNP